MNRAIEIFDNYEKTLKAVEDHSYLASACGEYIDSLHTEFDVDESFLEEINTDA